MKWLLSSMPVYALRSMETLEKFTGWPRVNGIKCHIPSLLDFLDLDEKMLVAQEFT
jgi:hypothetical protein